MQRCQSVFTDNITGKPETVSLFKSVCTSLQIGGAVVCLLLQESIEVNLEQSRPGQILRSGSPGVLQTDKE